MSNKKRSKITRTFDARPDTIDFRDQLYQPALVDVSQRVPLEMYQEIGVPILDQGQEGACTGFALASVAHYLLRTRQFESDDNPVSPQMLYQMAKRYDEWPGEEYEGSSARGAMKGWHKHGVCSAKLWSHTEKSSRFNRKKIVDAASRPLGAYYRVNHQDLVAMHAALTEVGILYATGVVHQGWERIRSDGVIPESDKLTGGHAFVLVGYNQDGFWLQNSWGESWGRGGFALLRYEDWLANGMDVWVARLGVPVRIAATGSSPHAQKRLSLQTTNSSFADLRPHIVSIGNDGELRDSGTYGTTKRDIQQILGEEFPRITDGWSRKRILIYAHGGLVPEKAAIERLAQLRESLLDSEIYPLFFIWKSDYWTTLKNILHDAIRRRRPEGIIADVKEFMLDRIDDALEPLARILSGKAEWDEMKENALMATTSRKGGARYVAQQLQKISRGDKTIDIHLVAHSAGSILLAPFVQLLSTSRRSFVKDGPLKGAKGLGVPVKTCTLWAPACTMDLFLKSYLPLIQKKLIKKFSLFTLTDRAEQDDDTGGVYNKSLLYLVSNAFEEQVRIPLLREGTPILGMERFIQQEEALRKLFRTKDVDWILAPNAFAEGKKGASRAVHHGDFDDDVTTLKTTLSYILENKE